jgi:flagellar protein FliO/FliZ
MSMAGPVSAMPAAAGLGQTALSLMLVLGAIFALAWLLRRVQGFRPGASGALQLQAGLQVGPKERVLLLRAGDKQLLIGVAAGQVRTLLVFDQPVNGPEAAAVAPPGFAEALRKVMRGERPQ